LSFNKSTNFPFIVLLPREELFIKEQLHQQWEEERIPWEDLFIEQQWEEERMIEKGWHKLGNMCPCINFFTHL